MDQVFRNTPYGTVTITDSMPQWLKDVWITLLTNSGLKPQHPPLVPTYEEQHYSHLPDSPPQPLNRHYFATEETAIELMHRFAAAKVVSVKKEWTEPEAFERWLVWPDSVAVNAGMLADEFDRNPEDQYPNVAQNAAQTQIDEARAKGRTIDQA